jgi:hypothetical protein
MQDGSIFDSWRCPVSCHDQTAQLLGAVTGNVLSEVCVSKHHIMPLKNFTDESRSAELEERPARLPYLTLA